MTGTVGFLDETLGYIEIKPANIKVVSIAQNPDSLNYQVAIEMLNGLFHYSQEQFQTIKAAKLAARLFSDACNF